MYWHDEIYNPARVRVKLTYEPYSWSAEQWSDNDFLYNIRFTLPEIKQLATQLQMPEVFKLDNGSIVESDEALVMFLARMADAGRLRDGTKRHGWEISRVLRAFGAVLEHIYTNYARALLVWNPDYLTEEHLESLAAAVVAKGCRADNLVSFLDGTNRGIARPGQNQRASYSGHKRKHCITWQGIVASDGMMLHLFPAPGARSNLGVVTMAGIRKTMPAVLRGLNGRPMAVYGDLGYVNLDEHIYCGYNPPENEAQAQFNREMSSYRICIEHAFGGISLYWRRLNNKQEQKLGGRTVARGYIVAAFLTNLINCLRPNQTSVKFDLHPGSLEHYMRVMRRKCCELAEEDFLQDLDQD